MKLLTLYIIFSLTLLFSSEKFNTPWGDCTLINKGVSYTNVDIKNIILKNIKDMNDYLGPISDKNTFTVIVDNGEFKTKNTHWDWSLGITYRYPEKIIIKDPSVSHITKRKFAAVLKHELNHILVNRIDSEKTIPRWFKEGFAMFYSDEISLNHKLEIAKNLHNSDIFTIYSIENFRGFTKNRFDLAYAQSAVYILTIHEIYGEKSLTNIILEMKNGLSFNEAFYLSTSKSINEFNDLLYPYLKKKYWWFNLVTLPNQLFAFFPLLLIIAFILRSIRNKKIEAKWELEEELEKLENAKILEE